MTPSPDVVVVGGGIEGLSTAWALAQRGVTDVLVLERATLCSGGTGKSSGVVRCHYGVRSLAAMAWYGLSVFEQAAELFGDDIGFRPTGYVVGVGADDVAALRHNVAMHRALGVEVHLAGHGEVQRMWPQADLDDFAAFAVEPRGGHGDAYRTGHAFARTAARRGVRIRQHAPVTAVTVDRSGRATGVMVAGAEPIRAGCRGCATRACGRPTPAATTSPRTTTRSSGRCRSRACTCAPGSAATASRSPRESAG